MYIPKIMGFIRSRALTSPCPGPFWSRPLARSWNGVFHEEPVDVHRFDLQNEAAVKTKPGKSPMTIFGIRLWIV
jgi:hypothetical protein